MKGIRSLLFRFVSTCVFGIAQAHVVHICGHVHFVITSNAPQSVPRFARAHEFDSYGQHIGPALNPRFSGCSETDNLRFKGIRLDSLSCRAKPQNSDPPSKAASAPRRGGARPAQPAQQQRRAAAAPASRGTAAERLQWAATPDAILDVFMRSPAPPSPALHVNRLDCRANEC